VLFNNSFLFKHFKVLFSLKKLLFRDDKFEIYIITWNTNQKSLIHDHSSNGCIYKVLSGSIKENIYDKDLDLKYVKIINLDNCHFISNDIGLHSMYNDNNDICVSLHIYSPSEHKTKYYNQD